MQIANTAKNSSPWNPSNLSVCVVHFLFPTGCTTSATQVSRRMDTEMDFVVFPHFSFDPISAKFARRMLVWKKAAVNYFPGNLSRAKCDHVHWRFLQARQMARLERAWISCATTTSCYEDLPLPPKVTFSFPAVLPATCLARPTQVRLLSDHTFFSSFFRSVASRSWRPEEVLNLDFVGW